MHVKRYRDHVNTMLGEPWHNGKSYHCATRRSWVQAGKQPLAEVQSAM